MNTLTIKSCLFYTDGALWVWQLNAETGRRKTMEVEK